MAARAWRVDGRGRESKENSEPRDKIIDNDTKSKIKENKRHSVVNENPTKFYTESDNRYFECTRRRLESKTKKNSANLPFAAVNGPRGG